MTSPLLERLARTIAARSTESEAGTPFGRNTLLRRGFAGALALSTLGHLLKSPNARAAACPKGSLDSCREATYRNFQKELVITCDREPSFAAKFDCLREAQAVQRNLQRFCERRCPPPKRKRPSGSKPTTRTRKPAQPPPLPPNPYDDGGLCAACTDPRVGGVCCWGGSLPGGFCICAGASTPCKAYGCP